MTSLDSFSPATSASTLSGKEALSFSLSLITPFTVPLFPDIYPFVKITSFTIPVAAIKITTATIRIIVFLFCIVLLPRFGFGGLTMRIYPCLCVGYFILFVMYGEILFLYYFNDLSGALATAFFFCAVTCAGSILATHLPDIWFGLGVVLGSFTGFTIAFRRLRWVEKHLDSHVFCTGALMKRGSGPRPSGKVYDRRTGGFAPDLRTAKD